MRKRGSEADQREDAKEAEQVVGLWPREPAGGRALGRGNRGRLDVDRRTLNRRARDWPCESGERGRRPHTQAASTESVVDGVEPPVALPLPPRMPSLPSVPSRALNLFLPPTGVMLLVRTIGADAPLRPFLRRGFDGVVQSAMPYARASGGCVYC